MTFNMVANSHKAVIVIILLVVVAAFFIVPWGDGITSSMELNRKYESMGWNDTLLSKYAGMAADCEPQLKNNDALRSELLSGKTVIIWQFDNGWTDEGNHFNWNQFSTQELRIPHVDPLIDTPENVSIIMYIHGYFRSAGEYTDGQLATDSCYYISVYNIETYKKILDEEYCNYAPSVKYHSGHGGAPHPDIMQILNNLV
jgi:hypothetical protein